MTPAVTEDLGRLWEGHCHLEASRPPQGRAAVRTRAAFLLFSCFHRPHSYQREGIFIKVRISSTSASVTVATCSSPGALGGGESASLELAIAREHGCAGRVAGRHLGDHRPGDVRVCSGHRGPGRAPCGGGPACPPGWSSGTAPPAPRGAPGGASPGPASPAGSQEAAGPTSGSGGGGRGRAGRPGGRRVGAPARRLPLAALWVAAARGLGCPRHPYRAMVRPEGASVCRRR